METSKKAAFVRKMGKKRLKLVKRQHFEGGGIAGLIGAGGGVGGTGFNVNPGTTGEQINNAYNQNQLALKEQTNLANTLEPHAYEGVIAQQTLSDQLANQALGQGPNVALNVLNQATGANVANQAALAAGVRGASANPALIARQAAMAGAGAQQQAAGQAATTQAEQQIAAQQARAQLASNQIAQAQGAINANTGAQQAEQGILQGANTANNNLQGQFANTTMQGQQKVLGGIGNAAGMALGLPVGLSDGGEVGTKKLDFVHKMTKLGLDHHDKSMADGGEVKKDHPLVSFGPPKASASSDVPPAQPAASNPYDAFAKSHISATDISKGVKSTGFADGGLAVPQVAPYQAQANPFLTLPAAQGGFQPGGGDTSPIFTPHKKEEKKQDPNMIEMAPKLAGPAGSTDLSGLSTTGLARVTGYRGGEMHPHFQGPHKSHIANYLSKGGPVPAMVSPGEVYLNPEQVHQVVHENADPLKIGQKFTGKAKVKGDSKKNDTIPATLEEGGVVIDREHVMNPEKAALFVHRAIARKRSRR